MNQSRPLSGVLMLAVAVGVAVAWAHGYLAPLTAKAAELLANPNPPKKNIILPAFTGTRGGMAGTATQPTLSA